MKDKLEAGMYVRTDKGEIKKVFQYDEQDDNPLFCTLNCYATMKGTISKASNNIIDLIEVGDYVNGYKIGYIDDCKGAMREFYYDYENPNEDVGHWEEEIKSVVTKEQFENMEYRIGE